MKPPRFELKYWCSQEQLGGFLSELSPILAVDEHVSSGDSYTISSLYWDTRDRQFYWDKVDGVRNRLKFRMRRYDNTEGGFLELKAKRNNGIRKSRVFFNGDEFESLASAGLSSLYERPIKGDAEAILDALESRRLEPSVIVRYERKPFVYQPDNRVRVTIDYDLACLGNNLLEAFFRKDLADIEMQRPEIAAPFIIEVKAPGPIPETIARTLRRLNLARRSISKYCLCMSRSHGLSYS